MHGNGQDLIRVIYNALEDKKGIQIQVIYIGNISSIADYFVIASGDNIPQVKALADHVQEEMEKRGAVLRDLEGYGTASWILMDYSDVVVHIFNKEDRQFYDIERIWRDGQYIDMREKA